MGGYFWKRSPRPLPLPHPPVPTCDKKKYPPATRPTCRGRATQGWMNSWDGALVDKIGTEFLDGEHETPWTIRPLRLCTTEGPVLEGAFGSRAVEHEIRHLEHEAILLAHLPHMAELHLCNHLRLP